MSYNMSMVQQVLYEINCRMGIMKREFFVIIYEMAIEGGINIGGEVCIKSWHNR